MENDIKTWLSGAGEPVAQTCFVPGEAPRLPYIIYLDTKKRIGGDVKNLGYQHSVTIERYTTSNAVNAALESLLDAENLKYHKEDTWLPDDECFEQIYTVEDYIYTDRSN